MANSYDVYRGVDLLGLVQIDLNGTPSKTNVGVTDTGGNESPTDLNILEAGETFRAPTVASGNGNQIWTYGGNVLDPDTGDAIGFYATRLGSYAIFMPTGTGGINFNITVNLAFQQSLDTESGWLINEAIANCFVGGTLIATPDGERAVEALQIGDMVLTACGREVAVTWIGRQVIYPRAASVRPTEGRLPVRISAHALGQGLPLRDLDLSADHAVQTGGYLVNAGALVNGASIRFLDADELPASFVYYHVETADHDVILAEGLPAETFVDYVGRRAFDNYAEYLAIYGAERVIRERPGPRISAARQLPDALRALVGLPDHDAVTEADHAAMLRLLTAA